MSKLLTRALPLLAAMLACPAIAASGTALDVDPDARIEAQSAARTLVVGTDVFIGDRISTDARGLVQIRFTDRTELRFADTRKFGRMAIVDGREIGAEGSARPGASAALRGPLHATSGIEPLSRAFTTRWLVAFLQRRASAAIKVLLLDPRGIAGIGNIYDCEALWRARIHPARLAGSLTAVEAARLHEAIGWVLRKGIRLGGASRRDYLDARGRTGRMQREFQVYAQADRPCPRCDRAIVRSVQGGRATFHCPRCQTVRVR